MMGDKHPRFSVPNAARDCSGANPISGKELRLGLFDDPSLYKPQHEMWVFRHANRGDAMDPKIGEVREVRARGG